MPPNFLTKRMAPPCAMIYNVYENKLLPPPPNFAEFGARDTYGTRYW